MGIVYQKTFGDVLVLSVDADPTDAISAPRGSLAIETSTGRMWFQTDSGDPTLWRPFVVSHGEMQPPADPSNSMALGKHALVRRYGAITQGNSSFFGAYSNQTDHFNMVLHLRASISDLLTLEDGSPLLSTDRTSFALDAITVARRVDGNDTQIIKWTAAWRRDNGPATLAGFAALNISHTDGTGLISMSESSNTTTGEMEINCVNNTAWNIYIQTSIRMVQVLIPPS
jgi:hypothetical protein